MQKPTFIKNKIYHIYNRGVEKRNIFMDKQDFLRFIHCLFEFNDESPTVNTYRHPSLNKPNQDSLMCEVGPRTWKASRQEKGPRKLLVDILIFTLMPNHFHLLLKQKAENGISKFMQKLGTGYTMYFNQKNERVGGLFQGNFKAVDIIEHAHFLHLPHYIHANPIKLMNTSNERGSTSLIEKQMKFLEDYKWSSFSDYINDGKNTGKKNFPSVTQREFLLDFWGGPEKYKKETKEWLKDWSKNIEKIKEVALD
ncbi:MAG: transposase [Candidatus Marinimicrobia bacterium]|nr:transposase [Candidatus Neomarinimicrobiota bacterium]